jgi:outer membrane protein assembly factor BamB
LSSDEYAGFYSGPVISGDKVILGTLAASGFTTKGSVLCLEKDSGKVQWKLETEYGVISTPRIANNTIYVWAGEALAIDLATGALKWKTDLKRNALHQFDLSGDDLIINIGNYAYGKTASSGKQYLLDAATGRLKWEYNIGGPSKMAYSDGILAGVSWGFFGGSRTVALDRKTGAVLWESSEPVRAWPLLKDGILVSQQKIDAVLFKDPKTGTVTKSAVPTGSFESSRVTPEFRFMDPWLYNGNAFTCSIKDKTTVLDAFDIKGGKPAGSISIPGRCVFTKKRASYFGIITKDAETSHHFVSLYKL